MVKIKDKIWPRIIILENGCWQWTGSKTTGGYGNLNIGDRNYDYVHRVVYEMCIGKIPDGLTIDHLCRNRSCINPRHLEAVTNKVNILRGNSWWAIQVRKTHCILGHPFSPENTVRDRDGARNCRRCIKIRSFWGGITKKLRISGGSIAKKL